MKKSIRNSSVFASFVLDVLSREIRGKRGIVIYLVRGKDQRSISGGWSVEDTGFRLQVNYWPFGYLPQQPPLFNLPVSLLLLKHLPSLHRILYPSPDQQSYLWLTSPLSSSGKLGGQEVPLPKTPSLLLAPEPLSSVYLQIWPLLSLPLIIPVN